MTCLGHSALEEAEVGSNYHSTLSRIGRKNGHTQLGIYFSQYLGVGSDREIQLDSALHLPTIMFLLTEEKTQEADGN